MLRKVGLSPQRPSWQATQQSPDAVKLSCPGFIDFCRRLLHDAGGPIFLVVDGHPTHRAKKVKRFVASTDGQLVIFTLPGYSPHLDPDEWVCNNVKAARIGRAGITSQQELRSKAITALRRLQELPHIVRGLFGNPNLAYITT